MGTLYFEPRNGLCNRWRALISAIDWANDHGWAVKFCWPRTVCPARFSSLWQSCGAEEISGAEIPAEAVSTDPSQLTAQELATMSAIRFRSGGQWYASPRYAETAAKLVPSAAVAEHIAAWKERLTDGPWVGIVIRANGSSHSMTKRNFAAGWFYSQIAATLAETPATRFFVLSDVAWVHEWLSRAFPDRIFSVHRSTYSARRTATFVEAVASIYLLSTLPSLLGSVWSSMSGMPALLNPAVAASCNRGGRDPVQAGEKRVSKRGNLLTVRPQPLLPLHLRIRRSLVHTEDILVSAIMVTSGDPLRRKLAQIAIDCFRKQTHPNKELVIVNHGELLGVKEPNIREYQHEKVTLGDLRNLGIRHADGAYCITWDDDDVSHVERITYQLSQALSANKKASVLGSFAVIDATSGEMFVRSCRAFKCGGCCSTILFRRDPPKYAYPQLNRGEDSRFADLYRFDHQLVVASDSPPLMYVRLYHGQNTSPAGHVLAKRHRRRLSPHESKILSGIAHTIADVGGLRIPGVSE